MRRGRRRRREEPAEPFGGGEATGDEPDGGGFHVTLAAGDLAGKAQTWLGSKPQSAIEQLWRVEERVAMKAAEAGELGPLETWNGPKDPRLLAVFELGLEAHHVEERAEAIVLAQLDDGVRLYARRMRIGEAERLHRPVAQCVAAALRHHLDRQAAVEIGRLPIVEGDFLSRAQGVDERLVFFARERTIDVSGVRAARARFVVARLAPGARHVDRIAVDDGADGIEEGECVLARELRDGIGEARRGQGSGGNDDAVP